MLSFDQNFSMHRLNPKYIRIGLIIISALLMVFIIGGFIAYSKREVLLQEAISKAKAKAKSEYNLDVKIENPRFTGLSTVAFSSITVVPHDRDTLLVVRNFEVGVKLMPLIIGQVKLAEVHLDDASLTLTDIKGIKNFDFLFHKKRDSTATGKKGDLATLAHNLVNQILYKIPDDLDMKRFNISFRNDSNHVNILTSAQIRDGELKSNIKVNNSDTLWHFAGRMHPSDKDIDISLFADKGKITIPYVQSRYHATVSFDTLTTRLNKVDRSNDETQIFSTLAVRNLLINQAALAANDIVVPQGSIDANIFVGPNYVSVDSSSTIHLKRLTAHPFIKYTLKPVKIYELKINTGWLPAQDIFDSFPQGTFESLQGIKVAGKLNYQLNFKLDTSNPKDVEFDSRLDKDGFKIVQYGKTNLGMLNGSFTHVSYVKGKAMPPRIIGPENPDYTPLHEISPELRNAVMTAEDPTFYSNNGFVEEAFRKSIATDYIRHKFSRGGSTISMQLVKNAFLVQEKTMFRKIEEIMIVWMLVNNHIMTKDRMLEVYFNMIEWGNNVYGIGEAARYYFGKTPDQLNLGESIYLASIVPRPRAGLYAFMPDGTLNPRLTYYFNALGNLMVGHGLTVHRDSSFYGFYNVRLKESLRHQLHPSDSSDIAKLMKADDDDTGVQSIPVAPPTAEPQQEEKKPGFFQRLFGKKDTTRKEEEPKIDTAGKTKKQIRQEKRELKRLEKQRRKEMEARGINP